MGRKKKEQLPSVSKTQISSSDSSILPVQPSPVSETQENLMTLEDLLAQRKMSSSVSETQLKDQDASSVSSLETQTPSCSVESSSLSKKAVIKRSSKVKPSESPESPVPSISLPVQEEEKDPSVSSLETRLKDKDASSVSSLETQTPSFPSVGVSDTEDASLSTSFVWLSQEIKKPVKKKYLFIPFRYRFFSGLTLFDFLYLCVYLLRVLSFQNNGNCSLLDPLCSVLNILDRISSALMGIPADFLSGSLSYFSNIPLNENDVPIYFDSPLFEFTRESIEKGKTSYRVIKEVLCFKEDLSLTEEEKFRLIDSAYAKFSKEFGFNEFFYLYLIKLGLDADADYVESYLDHCTVESGWQKNLVIKLLLEIINIMSLF